MRRNVWNAACVLGLSAALAAGILTGCGKKEEALPVPTTEKDEIPYTEPAVDTEAEETSEEETEAEENVEAPFVLAEADFDDILAHCTKIINSEDPWELMDEDEDPLLGLFEACGALSAEDAMRSIGYYYTDLNEDGEDELLIGSMINDVSDGCSNPIYAAFAKDGEGSRALFSGWSRNRIYRTVDGYFFAMGSSGADASYYGTFRIGGEKPEQTWCEFNFTAGEADGTIGVYRNFSGSWDTALSDKQDQTPDDFAAMESNYAMYTDYTPFTAFSLMNLPLTVMRLEDFPGEASTVSWVSVDESDYQSNIVFVSKEDLHDFKILALTFVDADDQGNLTFDTEEVYWQDPVTPKLPLGVDLSFAGDIPNYGISFTDANGALHQFTIGESGMDGSIVLSPQDFEPKMYGMSNPWVDTDAKGITEKLGVEFKVPDYAEKVNYRMMPSGKLAEMNFTTAETGVEICVRIQPTDAPEDISGAYFDWKNREACKIGSCEGSIYSAKNGDDAVQLCTWYDAAPGLSYAVTAQAHDLDGFDITAIANDVYLPMQKDV